MKKKKKRKLKDADGGSPRLASIFLGILLLAGALFAENNATAGNNSTTVKQDINRAGSASLDVAMAADTLLDNTFTAGLAGILNGFFYTTLFSGSFVVAGFILLSLWWKWSAISQWLGSIGGYILLTIAAFLIAKQLGII